jgi:hypothetical protein
LAILVAKTTTKSYGQSLFMENIVATISMPKLAATMLIFPLTETSFMLYFFHENCVMRAFVVISAGCKENVPTTEIQHNKCSSCGILSRWDYLQKQYTGEDHILSALGFFHDLVLSFKSRQFHQLYHPHGDV